MEFFIKSKSELPIEVIKVLKKVKGEGKETKFLRCDNAEENKRLGNILKTTEFCGIKMEYTAPGTPQQNGIVERSFAFLFCSLRLSYFSYSL